MKYLLLSAALVSNAWSAPVDTAFLEYTCTFQGRVFSDRIELKDDMLASDASSMYLGPKVDKTLTFRLERRVRVNDIYVILRDDTHLDDPDDLIDLGNISRSVSYENTLMEETIRYGFLHRKHALLSCRVTAKIND